MTPGICYVAFGDNSRAEAAMSVRALRKAGVGLPVSVVADAPLVEAGTATQHLPFDDPRSGARWAKLNLDTLSPYEQTLYLDADTRPRSNLSTLFAPLDAGFELVIATSTQQADRALWHVPSPERESTFDALGFTPVQLQAGVFAFRRSEAVSALFAAWREEWQSSAAPSQDQAALLRALYRCPVKVWLMSAAMSDALVLHLFGKAKAQ